jgi:sugar-specific transcriptional regulator TrmB
MQALGFTDKETTVYLALLASGSAPSSALAKRTGLPKSTALFTCQQLQKKGLVQMIKRGNTFLCTAEPPEKILLQMDRQKREIEQRQNGAQKILGDLRALMTPYGRLPAVTFYEGADGVREAYSRVLAGLEPGSEILSYLHPLELKDSADYAEEVYDAKRELQQFVADRIKKEVSIRTISVQAPESGRWKEKDADSLRETRIVQDIPLTGTPVEILIYGDSVCSVSIGKNQFFAYIVEHAGITEMQRAMFALAWDAAGKKS